MYRRLNTDISFEVYFPFKSTEGKFRLEMRNDASSFGTCIIGTSEIRSRSVWRMYQWFLLRGSTGIAFWEAVEQEEEIQDSLCDMLFGGGEHRPHCLWTRIAFPSREEVKVPVWLESDGVRCCGKGPGSPPPMGNVKWEGGILCRLQSICAF